MSTIGLVIHDSGEGGVALRIPATDNPITLRELSMSLPNGVPNFIVDWSVIPVDRVYRNAWTVTDWNAYPPAITVDMPRAREIHREYIVKARTPVIAQLDADYITAMQNDDAEWMAQIINDKNFLLGFDADPSIEAASTVEELKQCWHTLLGENPLLGNNAPIFE